MRNRAALIWIPLVVLAVATAAGLPAHAEFDSAGREVGEELNCGNCVGGECSRLNCTEKGGDLTIEPCNRNDPACSGEGGYTPGPGWTGDVTPSCTGDPSMDIFDENCDDTPLVNDWVACLDQIKDTGVSTCDMAQDIADECLKGGGQLKATPGALYCRYPDGTETDCAAYGDHGIFHCDTVTASGSTGSDGATRRPPAARPGPAGGVLGESGRTLEPGKVRDVENAAGCPSAPPAGQTEASPSPRAGFDWVPGHWEQKPSGCKWIKGHWERSR